MMMMRLGDAVIIWQAYEEEELCEEDGTEEADTQEDFTIFVSFGGNMEDEDFPEKLNTVLSGIPSMLDLG